MRIAFRSRSPRAKAGPSRVSRSWTPCSRRSARRLCDFIEAEAPATADIEAAGALPGRWADAAIVASYATPDPLN
jgi:hypothetical protein